VVEGCELKREKNEHLILADVSVAKTQAKTRGGGSQDLTNNEFSIHQAWQG
jgi:hypothetical protein